jgi:hypothetical protein
MMSEAYLDIPDLIKYYGEPRHVEPEEDDLSDRSTVSQMPLNFGLISEFKNKEDLTSDKVSKFLKFLYDKTTVFINFFRTKQFFFKSASIFFSSKFLSCAKYYHCNLQI